MGIVNMFKWTSSILAAASGAAFVTIASAAQAGVGDLLVAPTRIVLDGRKGAELVLNNIGDDAATYRVSVQFRRMNEKGEINDVQTPSAADKLAEDMIIYAPRKVTLAPHEPQAIRIAARPASGIADGEYRVHLLFRAIPPATPVAEPAEKPKGVQFKLTPVYGVTIPVIVRLGTLQATAGIASVQLEKKGDGEAVGLDLTRTGTRSTFGEVRVLKAGIKDPIAIQRGVAIYTEVGKRHVSVPLQPAYVGKSVGPVTVEYREITDDGSNLIASTQAVLR